MAVPDTVPLLGISWNDVLFLSLAGVMLGSALARAEEAPGKGWHWGQEAHHLELPRGDRVNVGTVGPLEEVLFGPGHHTNGTANLIGALRRSMATTGYSDLKEFQRVDVVVSPYAGN